ncbi:DUF4328 domain-containing protein [Lentzea sp. BCCO 10_0856]|uniref:DUF4328 domain-containing protein n=1 Tax=Lentzea miocenica TaxID=3095431 RepID=A0ABU4TGG5_9PSEU|nr:DUF4328 domain-containing protein [Lentzea sp. BCCO 10_0856]MDX8037280.1 DUF4328 domain-containing protein [Lentzea sp. BCCO 10_0856]
MSVVRPAHAIGTAAAGAIAIAVTAEVATTAMLWVTVSVAAAEISYWISLLVHVVAGVLFVVWMSQARLNADVITSTHQARYTNMWVFVGWIIPLANLFIPYAVMQDIWRGSDRTRPMAGLKQRPASGLVKAWWLCYIGSNLISTVAGLSAEQDVAMLATIAVLASITAAVLAAQMIKQVNGMQEAVPVQVDA